MSRDARPPVGGVASTHGDNGAAPDLRVGFILAPRFTMVAFAGLVDCIRLAADVADRSRQIHCRWSIISPDAEPLVASCGAAVVPWSGLPPVSEFDYIAVVGGLLPDCLNLPKETYDYLREAHEAGIGLLGVCTGSFILARAGLLDGRDCAVYTDHRLAFTEMFPRCRPVSNQAYVRDGNIFTCPGGTASIELAYAIIERHCGRTKAVKSLSAIYHLSDRSAEGQPPRTYWGLRTCGNWRVENAVALMERHMSKPFSVDELAMRIGSSVRELNRSFNRVTGRSPASIWRQMRLTNARWLLLNTTRSMTQIAYENGFSDAAHFSRWFHRSYGVSPTVCRRKQRTDERTVDTV